MREARFIKKNLKKWKEYQNTPPEDPDELAQRFIHLLDDLSYAKTFYPQSKVTRWVNGMAAEIYQSIYKNSRPDFSRFSTFWRYELPLIFRKYHRYLLFTFVLFVSIIGIALISCLEDPAYAREYFDSRVQFGYYDQTLRNISNGDPFGVYRDENQFSMFMRIAFNNISIAFKLIVYGLLFGVGTLVILWSNGLMLGTFQYIFFSQGVGWESVLVIWIHGTIEILSVVIAGWAGFILGTGWLFPGQCSRRQSFLNAARSAMKICICLIPLFLLASFFESYVTVLMSNTFQTSAKNAGLPIPVSLLILLGSFYFMLWYFVLYPLSLSRAGWVLENRKVFKKEVVK